jgi:hypothetical protein
LTQHREPSGLSRFNPLSSLRAGIGVKVISFMPRIAYLISVVAYLSVGGGEISEKYLTGKIFFTRDIGKFTVKFYSEILRSSALVIAHKSSNTNFTSKVEF